MIIINQIILKLNYNFVKVWFSGHDFLNIIIYNKAINKQYLQ